MEKVKLSLGLAASGTRRALFYFSFFERCVAKRPQTAELVEWWEGDFQVLETTNSLLGWELGFTRCDNDASMIM